MYRNEQLPEELANLLWNEMNPWIKEALVAKNNNKIKALLNKIAKLSELMLPADNSWNNGEYKTNVELAVNVLYRRVTFERDLLKLNKGRSNYSWEELYEDSFDEGLFPIDSDELETASELIRYLNPDQSNTTPTEFYRCAAIIWHHNWDEVLRLDYSTPPKAEEGALLSRWCAIGQEIMPSDYRLGSGSLTECCKDSKGELRPLGLEFFHLDRKFATNTSPLIDKKLEEIVEYHRKTYKSESVGETNMTTSTNDMTDRNHTINQSRYRDKSIRRQTPRHELSASVLVLGPGIEYHVCDQHSYMYISEERLSQMPQEFRDANREGQWFESDYTWSLVTKTFPDYFTDDEIESADSLIKNEFPHLAERGEENAIKAPSM